MATKPRSRKTAMQLWIADNRKRLGEKPADLARLTGVTTDTARSWESRGKPSEDALRILEAHFGEPAPRESAEQPGDVALLVSLVRELLDEVRQERAERYEQLRGFLEALGAAGRPEADRASEPLGGAPGAPRA